MWYQIGRIKTERWGLKSDKHRGPTALGVYFIKPRATSIYSTNLKPPRNVYFITPNFNCTKASP